MRRHETEADRFHKGMQDAGFDLGDYELAHAGDSARRLIQNHIDTSKKGYFPNMDDVAWRFRVEHRTVFRQAFDEDYREVMEHPKYEEFVEYLYDYFLAKDADIYAVAVKRNPHKYN